MEVWKGTANNATVTSNVFASNLSIKRLIISNSSLSLAVIEVAIIKTNNDLIRVTPQTVELLPAKGLYDENGIPVLQHERIQLKIISGSVDYLFYLE